MAHLKTAYSTPGTGAIAPSRMGTPVRRTVVTRVLEAVQALALCHNVTPVYEDKEDYDMTEADQQSQQTVIYQASSPDEVNSTWVIGPDKQKLKFWA